jgi:hypothetical protein
MKKVILWIICACLMATQTSIIGQTVLSGEYFLNQDPGIGNGTPLSFMGGVDSVNVEMSVPVSTLSTGFHHLFIRFKTNEQQWGFAEDRTFYLSNALLLAHSNLIAAEYFIDQDPGIGFSTPISGVNSSDSIGLVLNIPLNTLSSGFHHLFIRCKNEQGEWSLSEDRTFYIIQSTHLNRPNLVAAEYFVDEDPGIGQATPISGVNNSDSIGLVLNVPLNTLSSGFHHLFIRCKNQEGEWSLSEDRTFYILPNTQLNSANVVAAEYFIDEDPGMGQATLISGVNNSDSVGLILNVPLSALSGGFHHLFVRCKNRDGEWSLSEDRTFYILQNTQLNSSNLVATEYFLDQDPGIGQATAISGINNSDSISLVLNVPIQSLSSGFHHLFIRCKNLDNEWGLLEDRTFYIIQNTDLNSATIIAAEYFIDQDPGMGRATPISGLNSSDSIGFILNIALNNLSIGFHHIAVRCKNNQGNWGLLEDRTFYVTSMLATDTLRMIAAEYFIDQDPGVGRGIPLRVASPSDSLTLTHAISIPQLPLGDHYLNLRYQDAKGQWGLYETQKFSICTSYGATANFVYRTSNTDYTVYFIDSSSHVGWRRWDFGDGSSDTLQVNPAHRYTIPGTYQVCLKSVNGCGRDSVCKTVTIKGLTTLLPNRSTNTGYCIVSIEGFGFTNPSKIELFQGTTVLSVDSSFYLNNTHLKANFKFTNAPTGIYTLRVVTNANDTLILPNAFTIELRGTFRPDVDISGPNSILIGREFDYKVSISNKGNVAGFAVPVLITVQGDKMPRILNQMKDTIYSRGMRDSFLSVSRFYLVKDSATNDSMKIAVILIPYLAAGQVYDINLKIKSLNNLPIGLEAIVGNPVMDSTLLSQHGINFRSPSSICEPFANKCLNEVINGLGDVLGSFVPIVGCVGGARGVICDVVKGIEDPNDFSPYDFTVGLISTGATCFGVGSAAKAAKGTWNTIKTLFKTGKPGWADVIPGEVTLRKIAMECFPPPNPPKKRTPITVVQSMDPNLKEGPKGINALNCVSGEGLMPFTIYYENADSATAPASEVFIVDTLDATKFDLRTFKFTEFGFGDSVYLVNNISKSFVRDLDMRPRKNIILRISGDLDTLTGIVQWSFRSFDPRTMDLTQNINDGFLPPNRRKPEGEGKVGYTIRLRTGLPHLTTIRNKADIIFDVNPAIVTPIWTNTVDRVPPTSRVNRIARTLHDTVFTVHWAGVDPHAGILDYTVYVSENGSPFMEWLANTSSDSAQFIGARGRIYDFYVRARDYVGNIETKSPIAEASTGRVNVEPIPTQPNWLGQNRPNPSSGTTQIDFYLAESSSKVQLDVYNLAGIKVRRVLADAFSPGLHTITVDLNGLSTGIYFYRLESEAFKETKRMFIVE